MNFPEVELPRFRCHKVVRAAKITELRSNGTPEAPDVVLGHVGAVVWQSPEWHAKHRPLVGGYYVVYEDGYSSFSPAKAFEKGYAAIPADFRDRVRQEKAELDAARQRLLAYTVTPAFDALPYAEQGRMKRQAELQGALSDVLAARIVNFSPA